MGYDSLWVPESHFGADALPEPLLLLAAMAAVTERIRLGTTSYLLTLRNAVQAAEQVAVLDQLCGGRLILGVGRGFSAPVLQHGSRKSAAHAENQPPATQLVKYRHLLRGLNGIAQGQQIRRGAKPDPLGDGGHRREQQQGLRQSISAKMALRYPERVVAHRQAVGFLVDFWLPDLGSNQGPTD